MKDTTSNPNLKKVNIKDDSGYTLMSIEQLLLTYKLKLFKCIYMFRKTCLLQFILWQKTANYLAPKLIGSSNCQNFLIDFLIACLETLKTHR